MSCIVPCGQLPNPAGGRLLTLRIGERFEDVAALAARRAAAGAPVALRNVVLNDEAMPRIEIDGVVAGHGMANAALPDAAGAGAMAAAGMPALPWRADAGGMPAPLAHDMPAAAARLFARLPLAAPAQGGERLRLMLAGRLLDVRGARLAAAPAPACSGRACRTPDQVQVLDLRLPPGVTWSWQRRALWNLAPALAAVVARSKHCARWACRSM